MSKITLTPVGGMPTLVLDADEVRAYFEAQAPAAVSYLLGITRYIGGTGFGNTFTLPVGADLVPYFTPIAERYVGSKDLLLGRMSGRKMLLLFPDGDSSDSIKVELRWYNGVTYTTLEERRSTMDPYFIPEAYTRVIHRSTAPGPWSSPPDVAVLSLPVVETLPSGWDQMRERLLVPYAPYFAPGTRREHALDDRALPFATMLSQEERVVGFSGPWPIIELTSQGFAREKPWIIQTTGDYQGEVGSVSGVARNYPTVTVTWFSDSLQQTKTVIPQPAVPPETFGWQALSITSGLPNNEGWILVKRDVDPLPVITGSSAVPETNAGNVTRASANLNPRPTLCKVVDYYVYDPENTLPPND